MTLVVRRLAILGRVDEREFRGYSVPMTRSTEAWRNDPDRRQAAQQSLTAMHVALAKTALDLEVVIAGLRPVHPSSRNECGLGGIVEQANHSVYRAYEEVRQALNSVARVSDPLTNDIYIGNMAAFGREL